MALIRVKHLKSVGIPAKYLEGDLSTPERSCEAFEQTRKMVIKFKNKFESIQAKSPGTGLVIGGRAGTGKTMLASYLLTELFDTYKASVGLVNCDQVIKASNAKWIGDRDGENPYDVLMKVDVLLVDDVPRCSHRTKDPMESLHQLVRERFQRGKATVMTTSLDPQSLTEALGSDFQSFLSEAAIFLGKLYGSKQIPVQDYREKIAAEKNGLLLDD